jgi:DOCK N-terminus
MAIFTCVFTRPVELIVPNHSPIVLEITAVLREWGSLWKHLFVVRSNTGITKFIILTPNFSDTPP